MKKAVLRLWGAPCAVIFVLCVTGQAATVSPIDATGWNHDMVLNNPSPHDVTVTGTMDGGFGQVENWTWVEEGDYVNPDGDPQHFLGLNAGTHASLTGNGTFMFQPFDANNVVGLDGGESGTLSLTSPTSYAAIALYGASGFGSKSATVTLEFADSSTSVLNVEEGTGIGNDWFANDDSHAYFVGARASNKGEEDYTRLFYQENEAIHLYESYFELSPADQAKTLSAVTIENTGGDRMAVFALSGAVVPEPTSVVILAAGCMVAAARWRRPRCRRPDERS